MNLKNIFHAVAHYTLIPGIVSGAVATAANYILTSGEIHYSAGSGAGLVASDVFADNNLSRTRKLLSAFAGTAIGLAAGMTATSMGSGMFLSNAVTGAATACAARLTGNLLRQEPQEKPVP